jgi:Mrp family chromosome partitioning ATPase/capsular polysaccharide biosynthesis protein
MRDSSDATAIVAPLWKRKWMILIVAVLVAGASYAYYKRQPTVYSATTQLNLASGAEAQNLIGGTSKSGTSKAAINNAATIITSGLVAEEAYALLRAEGGRQPRGKVSVKNPPGSEILTITAEAPGAKGAARLANAYALAYITREHTTAVHAIKIALAGARQQLRRIELTGSGKGKGSRGTLSGSAVIQAASLSSRINQLESDLGLEGIQQISIAKAKNAELVGPQPKKNAIFGFAIGLVLAGIAAFALERADRSMRTLADAEDLLGAPILAALPLLKSPLVLTDGRPALARSMIEPVRRIHTTMRLRGAAPDDAGPRVILCTSPEAGDGKSTVVAALALVKREAGERVAVIEADFRRPVLGRLLAVEGERGLADVLAGRSDVWEVMQALPSAGVAGAEARPGADGETLLQTVRVGEISVLLSGETGGVQPLLDGRVLGELTSTLAEDYDCVLIDAPSPLEASDVIPLLSAVDGILQVARLRHTRDVAAERLAELLSHPSTSTVLGTVVNAVSGQELVRSGFSTGANRRRWPLSPSRR